MSDDPFAELDAAYVLGALSPAERRDYERHLETCDDCSRAVGELAGMPGILSRIPAADVLGDPGPPLPPSVLPALVTAVHRARRTGRRWVVGAAGLAAAALIAFFVLAGSTELGQGGSTPKSTSTIALAQTYQGGALHASVVLQAKKWGTQIDMRCTDDGFIGAKQVYLLFVADRSGKAEQIGTWRAGPGDTSVLAAGTALPVDQIARVEIRASSGRVLLSGTR
ncbi:MAG: zf-HC2 domain-containing protein [bacterium]